MKGAAADSAIFLMPVVLLNMAASRNSTLATSDSARRFAAVTATCSSLTNGTKQSILFIIFIEY